MNIPILSTMIFLPILGTFICTLVRKESSENSKRIAAFISCINSLLAAILWYSFEPHNLDFQFVEQYGWAKTVGINFVLGVDGISLFFVIMSTWLSTVMIFGTWYSVKERLREYTVCCLVLQSFMIGSFTAIDLLIFYVFFEAVLIPMFLIIGIWGGKNRIYATLKFSCTHFLGPSLCCWVYSKFFQKLRLLTSLTCKICTSPRIYKYSYS